MKEYGKPLLEYQVQTLRECQIKDITVVLGYMAMTVMVGTGSGYLSEQRRIVKGFDTLIDMFDIKQVLSSKRLLSLGSRRREILRALAYNSLLGPDCHLYYSPNRFNEFLRNRKAGPLFAHFHSWFFNALSAKAQ